MTEAFYDPILGRHGKNCTCRLCQEYWAKHRPEVQQQTKEPSQQEELKRFLDEQREKEKACPNLDYTEDSLVSRQSKRINELVTAHWVYQERLLSAGQDKTQTFTWDQVMEMRKWDYTSSAKHFYGHGYEDAQKIQQKMTEAMQIQEAPEGRR